MPYIVKYTSGIEYTAVAVCHIVYKRGSLSEPASWSNFLPACGRYYILLHGIVFRRNFTALNGGNGRTSAATRVWPLNVHAHIWSGFGSSISAAYLFRNKHSESRTRLSTDPRYTYGPSADGDVNCSPIRHRLFNGSTSSVYIYIWIYDRNVLTH